MVTDPAAHLTTEKLSALRRAREGELLVRFCDGNRLSEVEMAEIAHVLPAAVLLNPPMPEPARAADDYAADIGTSRRTVFRWLAIGREAKDPCPLDEPAKVLAWWSRRMSHKVPDYLSAWAGRARPATPATPPPASPGASAASATPPPATRASIDLAQLAGHGLERAVQIQRQAVEAAAKLLGDAYLNPNDEALSNYQRRYDEAVDQLRKAEDSLLRLQKARGDLAPRAEFRSELVTLLLGLRGMMRRRADNICATMAPLLTPEQLGHLRAAIVAEGEHDEKLLRDCRFWKVGPEGEVQLPAA